MNGFCTNNPVSGLSNFQAQKQKDPYSFLYLRVSQTKWLSWATGVIELKGVLITRSTNCTTSPPGAQWGALLSLHWVTGLSVEPLVPTKLRHLGISLVNFETVDHLADLLNH